MKKISKWAKINPKSSRIIIGFSHLFVVINGSFLGSMLFIFDCGELKWLSIIIANLFFISYLLYPQKDAKNKCLRHSYARQKIQDFSLVIFYSAAIALGVNNFLSQNDYDSNLAGQPTAKFIVHKSKSEKHAPPGKKPGAEAKGKIKKLRKQIKHELRELKKELNRQSDKGGVIVIKILLTLLTIILAFVLGLIITAFACDLSCSGNEGLAFAVLLLGWGGVIWLGIVVIKNIFRNIGRKEKTST